MNIRRILPIRHAAFTLVELLTVIAIIGILAAIIIPTVGAVRESARAARCTSNLRQLQLANIAHANNDRNGTYVPCSIIPEDGTSSDRIVWYSTTDYTRQLGITRDFDANRSNTAVKQGWPRALLCPNATIDGGWIARSYAYNISSLSGSTMSSGSKVIVTMSEIPRPSRVIAFVDALGWSIKFESGLGEYTGEIDNTSNTVAFRHRNTANAAFFDGHVERLDKTRLTTESTLWKLKE
ncbi:prepilin-type N-terminal cleavage/methylation domain-containing protein [Geminisphaera colitermitum]|uniref:prepilin-type N-terminal cleavage/methylation domain-containing protein n=1 Tax=Geminisphaera colitermitum TaxID=1148786 RepID=UPI000158C74F|nr:prepilin-type N-terminal cleavage/methylation domain-containing protein [Geminisphaera colitermitum]